MNYQDIVAKVQGRRIVVTGPHFSGAKKCAQKLAADLNLPLVESIQADNFVMAAPELCHKAERLGCTIIMMVRPFHEIVIAENAADWRGRKIELEKYAISGKEAKHKIISIIKYDHWYRHQRHLCPEAYEIDYHSLDK